MYNPSFSWVTSSVLRIFMHSSKSNTCLKILQSLTYTRCIMSCNVCIHLYSILAPSCKPISYWYSLTSRKKMLNKFRTFLPDDFRVHLCLQTWTPVSYIVVLKESRSLVMNTSLNRLPDNNYLESLSRDTLYRNGYSAY